MLCNAPLNVQDREVIANQHTKKQEAARASLKAKSKTRKLTPPQTFQVGDLVMIRDMKTKTKPRETYIIEQIPSPTNNYVLLLKFKNRLMPKLYRALPEEIIPINPSHPSHEDLTPATPSDNEATQLALPQRDADLGGSLDLKSTHSSVPSSRNAVFGGSSDHKSTQLPNPNRKSRQAAIKALHRIRNQVSQVKYKKKFAHGWNEEDQFDDDFIYCDYSIQQCEHSIDSEYDVSSSNSPSPTVRNDLSATSSQSDSVTSSNEEELAWDSTPDQYSLSDRRTDAHTWSSTPFTKFPASLPPAFQRERSVAFTHPPLAYRNAFRLPNNNQAFTTSPPALATAPHRSRIPLPTSPAAVNLSSVADFSRVLPIPVRRSSRLRSRPNFLGVDADNVNEEEGEQEEVVAPMQLADASPHSSNKRTVKANLEPK